MTKRDIRKLAEASHTLLDTVDRVASLLKKKDLKEYVRQLKLLEKKEEVIIALPSINSYNKNDNFFATVFPDKKIIYQQDPSLLLGARIVDNDMVYDFSLKSKLEEKKKMIEESF